MFKGSDSRKNLELTFGTFTEEIRNLEGKEVMLKNEAVKIKLYGLFDLCALNCIVGKQNHSASFPCAWTNVSKEHLQSENHTGNDHTEKDCKDVRFLSIQEYETNLTHHLVRQEGKSVSKSGKEAGSIIATNLCPLKDMSTYIPPLLNACCNGVGKRCVERTHQTCEKKDENERGNETVDVHHKKTQDKIIEMYDEVEDLEAQIPQSAVFCFHSPGTIGWISHHLGW